MAHVRRRQTLSVDDRPNRPGLLSCGEVPSSWDWPAMQVCTVEQSSILVVLSPPMLTKAEPLSTPPVDPPGWAWPVLAHCKGVVNHAKLQGMTVIRRRASSLGGRP